MACKSDACQHISANKHLVSVSQFLYIVFRAVICSKIINIFFLVVLFN